MMTDDALIAEYLKRRRPTKCPTAFCAATLADVDPRDAKFHAKRGDPTAESWRERRERERKAAKARKRKKRRG